MKAAIDAKTYVELSQLLFDGSYLVGLAATKELKVQSDQQLEQSRADARVMELSGRSADLLY